MSTKLKLLDVRLSFPDLFEAVEFKAGDGKPRYNASFLVVPGSENDKKIEAAIAAEVKAAFADAAKGAKWLAGIRGQSNKDCYTDGDKKEYDGYEGMKVLSSHRRAKDGPVGVYGNVIDPQTGKVVVLTELAGKPYAGSYVNATVEIYLQTKGENQGVRSGLQAVQFARDGDAFSGSKPATPDDFDALEQGADAEAMT
ncbi:MAG: DUF2815 family protein [Deltaproteobacteria bacterium]|nr:DUF2815 family protein [Deltaproteobacteria bacterium]